jgi:hypothetical protein
MLARQLKVGPQWNVVTDEQSIGVYNIKATDESGKQFFFVGYDVPQLIRTMTDAINEYDSTRTSNL